MARGSVQLRHRKACPAKAKDSVKCKCGPTVYAVVDGMWVKSGYLPEGWRKADLDPFERRLIETREALESGQNPKPRRVVKLADYATGWFEELREAAVAGHISKLTYNTYESIWACHLAKAFGGVPIAAIDGDLIRKYVAQKVAGDPDQGIPALSPHTVNCSLTPLSAMLTDAVGEGLITVNPCRSPRRGRHGGSGRRSLYARSDRAKPKHLEPVEALALLGATPAAYFDMVLTGFTTGFRRGELLGLRWEHVRWADNRIDLSGQLQDRDLVGCKYGSERTVVLYSGLKTILSKRRQAEGWVFLEPDGSRPWRNNGPEREFLRDTYETAGLREAGRMWHALRHTYASALAAGGIREDVVSVLMGHKRQGTTSIYSHLFADAFDGVEEALHATFATAVDVNSASTAGCVTTG